MQYAMNIDWQRFSDNPREATAEQLEEMRREWPYFVWPSLLRLEKGVADDALTAQLRTDIALAVGDREALAAILDPDADFADFYPDMKPVKMTTNTTIDTYLNRFGTDNDKETDLLTRMIFDSGPRELLPDDEYESEEEALKESREEEMREDEKNTQSTASERITITAHTGQPAPTANDATALRIDAFLAVSKQPAHVPEALMGMIAEKEAQQSVPQRTDADAETTPPNSPLPGKQPSEAPSSPSALTLSLAKMMIKNHNYAKALEIISQLNLENPEKSAYFADQIRFLKKLIIIQQQNHQ